VFLEDLDDHSAPRVGALKASDIESDPVVKAALAYLLHGELPRRSPFPSSFSELYSLILPLISCIFLFAFDGEGFYIVVG
jgi:hypothetical protein